METDALLLHLVKTIAISLLHRTTSTELVVVVAMAVALVIEHGNRLVTSELERIHLKERTHDDLEYLVA